MIGQIILLGSLALLLWALFIRKPQKINPDAKEIPFVKGAIPFFGHGRDFGKDIIGFMKKCYSEYGGIFSSENFQSKYGRSL